MAGLQEAGESLSLRISFALLILTALLGVSCGPVPGGRLEGVAAAPPTHWAEVIEGPGALCEVESRPEDPHSIQLYCFLHEGRLYAQSHRWAQATWWPTRSWALIWMEHPDVKVRIGEALYDLEAVHVTEETERSPIMAAIGYDPPPDGIALFRLTRR